MSQARYPAIATVRAVAAEAHRGQLRFADRTFACALGRGGISADKREGDGATPAGRLGLVEVLYRADRVDRPVAELPVRAIRRDHGWCDDPDDPQYNRLVKLPLAASHERLWLEEDAYDMLVVLDWNLATPVAGKGSAIFLHVASYGYGPTAGCVALASADLREVLAGGVGALEVVERA